MVADREEVDVGLTICAVEAHKAARKTTHCNENILTRDEKNPKTIKSYHVRLFFI